AAAPAGGSPSDPSHSPRLESEFDSFAAADWQARVHPEDRPRLLAAWHAAADEGRPFECEYRFRGPDGRWRHVVGRAAPVVHDGQPISEWVGTVVDVTDQRESRERLKQRDFLEAVLETVDDGIVACDERGERVVFNRQARQMHAGVTDVGAPEEWTARASLYRPDGKTPLPMEEIPLYRALQGEVVHDVEMVIAPPGRPPHTVLASGRRLVGPEGEKLGAVAVMRDVTETRRLENHLRQVQKMEAVGRLASGVAHDFNNLLTIINGYSDLLLSTLSPDHPGCDSAEAIRDAAERASDLTGQLLAFSRESVLAPRELDLNRAILGLEKMLRRLLGDDVTLTLALTATIGRVKVDPTHLTQMLMNLVVNARDAMPQGGKLTLETHPVTFAEDGPIGVGPVGSGALAPGRYVMIAVSDTGQGIPDELRSRIFEPFFTTKGLGCGTGLGLSTVYGIVKQSGGHIDVYSEVGHGTTFKIYLPAPDASLDGTQLLRDESTAFDSIQLGAECRETVLLVEDDPGVRRLTRRALEALGYRVLEAEDGEEALTVFERSGVTIDLLLTDVVMPRMNGRALAEALASRRPGTKVLYISGYPDEAAVLHDVIRAGSPFLRKPYSSQSLAQKLREVLEASSPGGSSIASGSSLSTGWAALAARPNAGEAPK
ncbi:MAG TPA: ATP-binding protein, partial [Pirellulales bacterium]